MTIWALIFLSLISVILNGELLQVISLSRHGARYYANDIFNNGGGDKNLWMQLTPVGIRQQETLGKMLRADYIESLRFLSDTYNSQEIQVYSTNVNRTIMSAISLMYGLYPLNDQENAQPPFKQFSTQSNAGSVSSSFEYQEVYIHFNETLLPTQISPALNMKQGNRFKFSKQLLDQKRLFHQLFEKLSKILNTSIENTDFQTIVNVYDTLTVDSYLENPLPKQISPQEFETIIYLNYWYNYLTQSGSFSYRLNRYKIKLIINSFDKIIQNKLNPLKWTFLISHDQDLTSMINDFNISSSSCITQIYFKGIYTSLNCHPGQNFSSNLIFELHQQAQQYWVKIRHEGEYMYVCQKKSKLCLYSEFKQRMINYLNEQND